ncbi:MAG: ATP-binding protein [Desulfobacterales bacterium]
MPEISIESSRARQSYGLTADEIFWVRQGILSISQLRESEDEEFIADLIVSILLNEPFAKSKEKLNELYKSDSELYAKVETSLILYPTDNIHDEIKQVFSIIRETIEAYDPNSNALRNIVAPGRRNPIKSSFYAIFMAFHDLLVRQNKSPVDSKEIIEALKNHQLEVIPSAHYTKSEDRVRNINKTIGLIQGYFAYKEPSALKHGYGLAIDFENSLRRSRIETPRYEFKQGLLGIVDDPTFNSELLDRIANTICGMANLGPNSEGFIYLGVADTKSDAERIKTFYGIEYFEISNHYVVGIDREALKMKLTTERYLEKIVDHIRSSGLPEPLKTQVLTQIDTVSYKNYTIVRIKVPAQSQMSFVENEAYVREGNQTIKIEGKKIVAVNDLFNK